MTKLELLRKLSDLRQKNPDHPAIDSLTDEAIDTVFKALPKLLALAEAAEDLLKFMEPANDDERLLLRQLRLGDAIRAVKS